MFRTMVLSTLGLAVAVGAPIALFSANNQWDFLGNGAANETAAVAGSEENAEADTKPQAPALPPFPSNVPLEGAPVRRLDEVFRFDVSTGWVMQRWPRVSTGMADLQLQGYRVPLMTGVEPSDLAGSLTYYFNAKQQMERITFTGTTGDAREIVALVTRRYKFTRRLTNNPGLFIYERPHSKRKSNSILQIRLAQVVRSDNPFQKFDVTLSLERP